LGVQPQLLKGGLGTVHGSVDEARTAPLLILGMGNPILCDDAVGLRLARDARRLSGGGASVEIVECTVGGLNLLDVVAGHDRLVVLDSIKTLGGRPGDWYRFGGARLRETMNLSNVHDANFATTLELGRRMSLRLPCDDDVHIFAVEVRDNLTFSESMSTELERAYPELARQILSEIQDLVEEHAFRSRL
jgi:hydrogenase maturation protease